MQGGDRAPSAHERLKVADGNDVLIMLGRMEGKIDETRNNISMLLTRLESMEEKFNTRANKHEERIRALEVNQAKTALLTSAATSAVIAAGVELAKRLIGH